MTDQRIKQIPIREIRVVNPRTRNRVRFQHVMASIATLGLKKPVTVYERGLADDGTRYDLVCGQGRLESVRDLGETMIPAIICDAPEDERYLMSLVENLARRPPSNTELLREVKRLKSQHFGTPAIAAKLGMDKSHIYGIMTLLQRGEEDLIRRVEAGHLPLETAVTIAAGKDVDIQRALSEAYESGLLRGTKLQEVQRLINRRKNKVSPKDHQPLTGRDLVRAYEHHTQQQRALVRRSTTITHRLAVVTSSLRRLWADEHFLTLLRAEHMDKAPEFLANRIAVKE